MGIAAFRPRHSGGHPSAVGMTQPPRRWSRSRRTLTMSMAVALVLPTIAVTPPDFGHAAGARSTILSVSHVTNDSATLTIAGHQRDWYYKNTRPSVATCSPVAAGTSTAELTGLTPETSYTYRAYSDPACSTVLATALAFTTPAAPAMVLSTADLTVTEGSTDTYTVALAAPPEGPVVVTIAATGDPDISISVADCDSRTDGIQLCFTTRDYSTRRTVTVAANEDNDGASGSATIGHTAAGGGYDRVSVTVTEADIDTTRLDVTGVGADGATLDLVGHAGAWWYQGDQAGADCTRVAEGTAAAQVEGLVSGASYTFTAYSDPLCENAGASAAFTTYGIVLTPGALTITEGNTDTYTIALTAQPTGSVKVTVAETGATNLSFTAADCDSVTPGTQLCFTTTNYSTAQTVTVTAAEDNTDTADGTATLTHAASGGGYANVSAALAATESDNDPRLAVSGITHNSATLAISNYAAAWYYRHTTGTCSTEVSAGTDAATVTNLTAGTQYTYTAYSDSTCTATLATASAFTTPGVIVTPTTVSVTEGSTATYTVKLATQPAGNVKVTLGTTGDIDLTFSATDCHTTTTDLCFTTTTYNTAQTVTVSAAQDSDNRDRTATITHTATGADYNNITATVTAAEDDNEPQLAATNITHNSATLTISNHTADWYHKHPSGTCSTKVAAGTYTATVTNLTANYYYTFTAYSNSGCTTALAAASPFTTLTAPALVFAPTAVAVLEGSTATYTIALAIQPTGDVKVALAKTGDTDIMIALILSATLLAPVYITFDDGPHPDYTPPLLEVLAAYEVKATFFVTGKAYVENGALARRIVAEGHTLANHTWAHKTARDVDADTYRRSIVRTQEALGAWGTACFRPPEFRLVEGTAELVAAEGLRLVMKTVNPKDWQTPGADALGERIAAAGPGDIVVLHDGLEKSNRGNQLVEGLTAALNLMRERGLTFAPVCTYDHDYAPAREVPPLARDYYNRKGGL